MITKMDEKVKKIQLADSTMQDANDGLKKVRCGVTENGLTTGQTVFAARERREPNFTIYQW